MADETENVEEYPEGALVFRTLPHAGSWTFDGETYTDTTVVTKPKKALIRAAGHAHAAGTIEVLQGLDMTGVQSQEDGEAAYEAAVESGDWHVGQEMQAILDAEARERGEYGITVEVEEG
jgi:hypothetical protein